MFRNILSRQIANPIFYRAALPSSVVAAQTTQYERAAFATYHSRQQRQEQRSHHTSMFLFAPLAAMMLYQAANSEKEVASCDGLDIGERLRGTYENKIRFFCAPEKIFEIFASQKNEAGKLVMSYEDFFKCVTPFNYTSSANIADYFKKYKVGSLELIDADGSGQIDFTEFVFFIILLQIQPNKLRKRFKKYPARAMDKAQFSEELRDIRNSTIAGKKQVDSVKIDGRQVSASDEEFRSTNRALVEKIFKNRSKIVFSDFMEIRKQIREDLWHYDFHTYEIDENDTISLEDFLKSNIVCVSYNMHKKYLKQIDRVIKLMEADGQNKRITYKQFKAFQLFLDEVGQIHRIVSQYKSVDYDLFQQLFTEFESHNIDFKKEGLKFAECQYKSLFLMLDSDESGEVEEHEVIPVLQPKQLLGQDREQKYKDDASAFISQTLKATKQWFVDHL